MKRSTITNKPVQSLSAAQLSHTCNPESLGVASTNELPDLQEFIGQPRAYRALELGSEVDGRGYNIFVMGLPGSGRTTLTKEYLERVTNQLPIPNDWVYVNNFSDPHKPLALELPVGRGTDFRKDMQALVLQCTQEIRRAFQSEEYKKEKEGLITTLQTFREKELERLQAYAAKYNFLIARTTFGFVLVPAIDGQPLKPEEVEKLEPKKLEKLKKLEEKIGEEVKRSLNVLREQERLTFEKIQELDRRTTLFITEHLINTLRKKYTDLEQVGAYIGAVQSDIVENVEQFIAQDQGDSSNPMSEINRQAWLSRYMVNVLIDNSVLEGAPVIVETQPSYHNLIGRIEHQVVMGASRTDFTMIQPGALHRANGGYLILPVRDLLANAYAWEGLKSCLRNGNIRIIELGNQLGLVSTSTLEPEPIPLNVKVVLIGTPALYYLLRAHDEDFAKLFKVRAEFATQMDRTSETEQEYALFIQSVVLEHQLAPFHKSAIARIIEYGSRLVSDQGKLSTRFGQIADVIRESAYWGGKNGPEMVTAEAVEKAIDEYIYRSNLMEERMQELIREKTFMIDVSGSVIGQINALSVLSMGDYDFGRPNRVTATVYPGKTGVIDIESKAELGGPIHTKGVLILSGFLSSKYGRHQPLSLSANLTFEQSYSGVDGDSASAAELYALLSAVAQVPIRQDLAITGSINQRGQIQPISGVNEKIEGFFTTCKDAGLTGTQGVIIPAANVSHLMLKREVVEAVRNGQFRIYPITTIDEGLQLLTGMVAGELDADRKYPEGTFNALVLQQLSLFTEVLKSPAEKNSSKH